MKHLYRITLFFLFAQGILQAQVGDTGAPLVNIIDEPVCWHINGIDSSLTRVNYFMLGENSNLPFLTKYLNGNNQPVDIFSGSIHLNYCSLPSEKQTASKLIRQTNTNDFQLAEQEYLSYTILNTGWMMATITDVSGTSLLHPGENYHCSAQFDTATNEFIYCPPIDVRTNGSTINYSYRTN